MAKATLDYGGVTAKGEFTFNQIGKVISFKAERFYDQTGNMETWFIAIDEESYHSFDHIIISTKASVTWKLAGGDFTWYKLMIDSVAYQ